MFADNAEHHTNADWCNGSTADSDSVSRGSSPLSVVIDAEYFVRDTQHFAYMGAVFGT